MLASGLHQLIGWFLLLSPPCLKAQAPATTEDISLVLLPQMNIMFAWLHPDIRTEALTLILSPAVTFENFYSQGFEIQNMTDPGGILDCDPDHLDIQAGHVFDFFQILEQPGVLRWLFNDLNRFAQESGSTMDRFPEFFTTVSRYYNFSQILLAALVNDSLTGLSGPELIFRSDHLRTRLLREFTSQSLGSTLTSHLEPIMRTLVAPPLFEAELSQTGRLFIDRLLLFRFPSEFSAGFGIISRIITQKFPEYPDKGRIGLSVLLFLRYLFPLILNSPDQFHLEMSPGYQANSLQLIKRIQPLAVGDFPSNLFSFDSELHREAIETFFSRLSSTSAVPSSFLLCTMPSPDGAVRDLFELLERFSHSLAAQSSFTSLPSTTKERWLRFFLNRKIPLPPSRPSSSLSPYRSRRRAHIKRASGHGQSLSLKGSEFSTESDTKSSKSLTQFSSTARTVPLTPRAERSLSDTCLEASRGIPPSPLRSDRGLCWGQETLSLTAILRRLEDCFLSTTTAQMFELEIYYFVCCHPLFVSLDDLLDYLLNHYSPGISSATQQDLRRQFVSALIDIWIGCDPRLGSLHPKVAPRLSGNDSHSEHDRPSMATIIQDPRHAFSLQTVPISERRVLRKRFLRMDLSDSAKHMQDAHLYFHQKVYPWDVIGALKNQPSSACGQVAAHFNNIVSWVQTTCLQPTNEQKRIKRISKWIAIGHTCYLASFLSPLLMIQTALSNQVISRLRNTWSRVPHTLLDRFEEIQKVCSPPHNYVTLRNIAAYGYRFTTCHHIERYCNCDRAG